MTHILVATDAWHPQVNGVVRTLTMMAEAAKGFGVEVSFLTPQSFRTFAMPSYPDLRLALPNPWKIAELIDAAKPDSIHIATEGPIGLLVRRYCRKRGLPFTTSFHTRFPEYVSARSPIPESWVWRVLRWFHRPSQAVMAATPALAAELRMRGFRNVVLWSRGVDTSLFHPRDIDLCLPTPVFLSVGRVAVEKNLEAFLDLDLPGTKLVVGDGPARMALERKYPDAVFHSTQIEGKVAPTGPSDIKVHGVLSLHGSDHEITAQVHAELSGDRWKGTASFDVPYISWGIKDPSNFFLKVKKVVSVELEMAGEARTK